MQSAKMRHGCRIKVFDRFDIPQGLPRWHACANWPTGASLTRHPGWLTVLAQAMKHEPYCLEATVGTETVGLLPMSFVRSLLFGRFVVSLLYLK